MKTPSTPGLLTLINGGGPYVPMDAYTFTLASGVVLRWVNWETDLVWSGVTFLASGPILQRGPIRQTAGREVQTLTLTLGCGDDRLMPDGKKITLAAAEGAFDGAEFRLDRLYLDPARVNSGSIDKYFTGRVAQVEPSSTAVRLTIKSELERLNLPMPRRLFQPACPHELYGAACGIVKAPIAATCVAGSTTTTVLIARNDPASQWALGTAALTSGACAGQVRQIASSGLNGTTTVISLTAPLPSAPVAGDTVSLLVGCDKSLSTCKARFANGDRFGGTPWVPKPESVR